MPKEKCAETTVMCAQQIKNGHNFERCRLCPYPFILGGFIDNFDQQNTVKEPLSLLAHPVSWNTCFRIPVTILQEAQTTRRSLV